MVEEAFSKNRTLKYTILAAEMQRLPAERREAKAPKRNEGRSRADPHGLQLLRGPRRQPEQGAR